MPHISSLPLKQQCEKIPYFIFLSTLASSSWSEYPTATQCWSAVASSNRLSSTCSLSTLSSFVASCIIEVVISPTDSTDARSSAIFGSWALGAASSIAYLDASHWYTYAVHTFSIFDTPSLLHLGWCFISLTDCDQALDCMMALHLLCTVSPCFPSFQGFFFTSIFVILHLCCRFSFTHCSYIKPWVVTPRVIRPHPQHTRLATKGHNWFPGWGIGTGVAS